MPRKYITISSVFIFMFFCPNLGFAASLNFSTKPSEIRSRDTFVVELDLDSQSELLNVVDGVLSFDKDILEVQTISTGGSILNLWTRTPSFSNEAGRIFFTGGSSDAFSGSKGAILKIVFLALRFGEASLTVDAESAVYASDGKGTKLAINPSAKRFLIEESSPMPDDIKNEWSSILVNDKMTPEDLIVKVGREISMFDNQYFLSFHAIDRQSGIDHFEVKEGEGEYVQSESPYILEDQSLKSKVTVKAIDKAGNEMTRQVSPEEILVEKSGISFERYAYLFVIVLVLWILGQILWKMKRKLIK